MPAAPPAPRRSSYLGAAAAPTASTQDAADYAPLDPLPPRRFDTSIIFVVGLLMSIGVVMVYSASVDLHGSAFDWRSWWQSPLRQCVFAAVGLLGMIFAAFFDYRFFEWRGRFDGWWSGLPALVATVLLVLVLVPGIGQVRLGAARSLPLPIGGASLGFQPSELAKLALVLWLAALLTRPNVDVRSLWRGYAPALASAGVLIGLTAIEDFGTAALMGVITMALLYLAGARWTHLLGTALLGCAAGALLILRESYRVKRLVTFFAENPDPAAEGYQVNQSLIAIGSGSWWGVGLGNGIQKYDYLPQDNNDFILAVLCEELGVAGGIAVILLFLVLLWRGWLISARAGEPFGRLVAAGITLLLCLQAAFNIGVVTNSVPTKGISLPFVSAGGSGVVVLGLAAGVLASVGRNVTRPRVE